MGTYFNSNHTTSRFLANNQSTPPQPQPQPQQQQQQQQQQRSRVPASKHFSTSITQSDPAASSASNGAVPVVHPLRNTWIFWFRQQRAPGIKNVNYEEGIKKISAFSSVESFWSLWTHLAPPSALLPTTDYLLFHTGIRRPVWEDPLNITGGKWIIRLKKGVADRLWEDLVLAVIGDQFDECGNSQDKASPAAGGEATGEANGTEDEDGAQYPEICGCTISVRQNEDIISLWNRYEVDYKVREKIRDTLKRVLNLPQNTTLEYKTNNDSMQDRSSFRTTNLHDRTPHS